MGKVSYSHTTTQTSLQSEKFGDKSCSICSDFRLHIKSLTPSKLAAEHDSRKKLELLHDIVCEYRDQGKPLGREQDIPEYEKLVVEFLSDAKYYNDLREHGNVDIRNYKLTELQLRALSLEIWEALRWQAARTAGPASNVIK